MPATVAVTAAAILSSRHIDLTATETNRRRFTLTNKPWSIYRHCWLPTPHFAIEKTSKSPTRKKHFS
jgi:hypothetical protein